MTRSSATTPLEWSRSKSDDDGYEVIRAVAADSTPSEREVSSREMWRMVRESLPWGGLSIGRVIRLEVWPDTGQTFVFVADVDLVERDDTVAVAVEWPALQATWNDAESDESVGDEVFDALIGDSVIALLAVVSMSFFASGLKAPVHCYLYGEERIDEFHAPAPGQS